MPLITELPSPSADTGTLVEVHLDRHTLEKRRWRTLADDGTDIAVDLPAACRHGDILMTEEDRCYVVVQKVESVIAVAIPDDTDAAARLGWFFGNQHLPVEIEKGELFLEDELQLAKRLEEQGIAFRRLTRAFCPDPHSRGHHHHHHC